MKIEIRRTVESDLDQLLKIRSDPLVQQSQLSEPPDRQQLCELLFVNSCSEYHIYEWHSILGGGQLVGYITTTTLMIDESRIHYVGFNLAPEHWNKGVMTKALSIRIDQIFSESDQGVVAAETICTNLGCIAVLGKLHFEEIPVGWTGQLIRYFTSKFIPWTNKYRLTYDQWIPGRNQSENGNRLDSGNSNYHVDSGKN